MKQISIASEKKLGYPELLSRIQEYMPEAYSEVMSSDATQQKFEKVSRIKKFVIDNRYSVDGLSQDEIVQKLYDDMVMFSFLTPYLTLKEKGVEGIEIHSWDCVKIKRIGHELEYLPEHFYSPKHAHDIIQRIMQQVKVTLDDAKPLARSHLADKIRITAIDGGQIVDANVATACSIRFVNPNNLTGEDIIRGGTLTREMLNFLCTMYRYGVSLALSGETDAGKTTLISIIMRMAVPYNKILITIENGNREFNLVVRDDTGKIVNSVLHLNTRETNDPSTSITSQKLLEHCMTMNPDYMCMAEVRGSEAYETVEAAQTHPVIITTHAKGCKGIPKRLMQLASIKGGNMSDKTLYDIVVDAFPILIYVIKGEDGVRRVVEISECKMKDGYPVCYPLWVYKTDHSYSIDGKKKVDGHFEKVGMISKELQYQLRLKNIPDDTLECILSMKGDSENENHRIDCLSPHKRGDSIPTEPVAV